MGKLKLEDLLEDYYVKGNIINDFFILFST